MKCAEFESKINTLSQDLKDLEESHRSESKEYANKIEDLNGKNKTLNVRNDTLMEQERQLSNNLASVEADLHKAGAEIESMRTEHNEKVARYDTDIKSTKEASDLAKQQLESNIDTLNQTIKGKDEKARLDQAEYLKNIIDMENAFATDKKGLDETISNLQKDVENRTAEIKRMDIEAKKAKQDVSNLETKLKTSNTDLQAAKDTIKREQPNIAIQAETISQLRIALDALESNLGSQKQQCRSI